MLFVISIVPFLSAVTIAFLYESEFWMTIISGGRLFQALTRLVGITTCRRQSWLEGWRTIQCAEYVRHALT